MNKFVVSLLMTTMIIIQPSAWAGLYTDDLSRCLVSSTTPKDKVNLVKWMFTAASRHPAVSSIASVSDKQLDDMNKEVAELFVSLLTETCKEQAQKAVRYEGQIAIQGGFQVLGQVAAAELFSSPEVSAGMDGLAKHIDNQKLQEVFGSNN